MMLPLGFRSVAARSIPARFFSFSSAWGTGNGASQKNGNVPDSPHDFEHRIFGSSSSEGDPSDKKSSFLEKLSGLQSDFGIRSDGNRRGGDDGMDLRLRKASKNKLFYPEMRERDYKYRPDVTFYPGNTYSLQDLDLTKPAEQKPRPKKNFTTTTEEALRKADFRNVRYLANFLTESGLIIKRKATGIRAKAQRRVVREIKTARAFGLLPFISMGGGETSRFRFGKSAKADLTQFVDNSGDQGD